MKEGWEYKKLKEVGQAQTGTTPSKQIKSYYGGDIPFIRPAELNIDQNGEIKYDSELKLTEEGALKSRVIKANSVLMCCIGSVGKTGFSIKDVTCNQQINTITPYENCYPRFVYYALISPSFQQEVIKIANSAKATLPIISKGKWEELSIPVPPLTEQQSIVVYLDAAFAKIDALKANAEKALNEAQALFQASLKEMLEPKEGWEEKKLMDIGELKNGMNFNKNESGYNVHILGVGDFGKLFLIDDTDCLQTISLNSNPSEEYILKNEDIVFVRSNGNKNLVGRCVLIHVGEEPCSFSGFCIRFRKSTNEVDACYLTHFLKTENARKKLVGNGANISNLNQKVLNEFVVSYPSISEQQSIVDTLDSLKSKVDKLQENYDKISQECDALKQAILRQVFE